MLSEGDVWVHSGHLRVRGPDGGRALSLLAAGERALPAALRKVAARYGDEVIVVKRVALEMRVSGETALVSEGALVDALAKAIEEKLKRGARTGERAVFGAEAAWFESSAVFVAYYLEALQAGSATQFPYSSLSSLGASWDAVLLHCEGKGRVYLADVLAELHRTCSPGALGRQLSEATALRLLRQFGAPGREPLSVARLPVALSVDLASAGLAPAAELAALAELFALWPPARDMTIVRGEPRTASILERKVSAAGGLIAWALLLESTGLSRAWRVRDQASRDAARALGCALEGLPQNAADPLLLLFSHEAPDASLLPLLQCDPVGCEALHAASLSLAWERGWLEGDVRVCRVAERIVAFAENGIVVDTLDGDDLHAAAEELVRRLSRRTGRVPRSVVVLDEALPADLDAVLAVDVSHVPRWQPGLRAAASVLRHAARVDLDCELSDMRKWPALLSVSPNQVSVELRRGNVNRVGRIREVSRLGGRVLSLSVR
ncbi:MAG: hypothetical protein KC776_17310 [Myxococcales bacterium]|nr:hypothetical protein [Myxococcales bacterium]MCB9580279.1 hypothetical protein [Polyangiaceae bacterium]